MEGEPNRYFAIDAIRGRYEPVALGPDALPGLLYARSK
jgi:hypothetical protein